MNYIIIILLSAHFYVLVDIALCLSTLSAMIG